VSPCPNRRLFLLGVVVVALVAPAAAAAHSRSRVVALDVRLRLERIPGGIQARVLDGDRSLQLTVDPSDRVVVLGALGEPMLRFDAAGVWANRGSPTASADRIVPPGGTWVLLARARSFRWHDHRLAPRPGPHPRLSVPLVVNGHVDALTGSFTRVARPSLWPWLLGAAVVVAALARLRSASVCALVSSVAALALAVSFRAWLDTTLAALAVAVSLRALLRPRGRAIFAGVAGAAGIAISLAYVSVFWHGVVLSSSPGWLVRLATGLAFTGGALAVLFGVLASESGTEEVGAVRTDVRADL
jgi:hypothetical protein